MVDRPSTSATAAARPDRDARRAQRAVGTDAVVVQAAGSMPGDLQMLWRAADPKQYHVEYAFSCMGTRSPARSGVKMAAPEPGGLRPRRRRLLPDDGPGDRHRGVRGHQAGGRHRAEPRVRLDRGAVRVARLAAVRHQLPLPQRRDRPAGRRQAADRPRRERREPGRRRHPGRPASTSSARRSTGQGGDPHHRRSTSRPTRWRRCRRSESWWDVPVSQVSELDSTQQAYKTYEQHKATQRPI